MITLGQCWIDKIDVAYKEGQLKHVKAQKSGITYKCDRKLCQVWISGSYCQIQIDGQACILPTTPAPPTTSQNSKHTLGNIFIANVEHVALAALLPFCF